MKDVTELATYLEDEAERTAAQARTAYTNNDRQYLLGLAKAYDDAARWASRLIPVPPESEECPGAPEPDRTGEVLACIAWVDAAEQHRTPAECTKAAIRAYLHAVTHEGPISLNHQREVIR